MYIIVIDETPTSYPNISRFKQLSVRVMQRFSTFWTDVLVNKSNRPILVGDESIVFVQNNVGLYQGKAKIPDRQDGRVYLTNRRIVYLDNKDHAKSLGLPLEHILRAAAVERFLRSSPKVKVFLRPDREPENAQHEPSFAKPTKHWLCRICSYSNPTSAADTDDFVKCAACGIKSRLSEVKTSNSKIEESPDTTGYGNAVSPAQLKRGRCLVCTFINHPMLRFCEICGTELPAQSEDPQQLEENKKSSHELGIEKEEYTDAEPYVKFSFRQGGNAAFYLHLQSMLEDQKWHRLQQTGAINENGRLLVEEAAPDDAAPSKFFGIHGLERRGERQRQENELIINSSLLDFEQLMFKYQDLLHVSEALVQSSLPELETASQNVNVPTVATNCVKSEPQLQEIARQISEYLINFKLSKLSSIITVQDLYSSYNRHLVLSAGYGTPLLGPAGFSKAISLMNDMNLPVILREYGKSGLIVLSHRETTEQASQDNILKFMRALELEFFEMKFSIEITGLRDAQLILQFHHYSGCSASQVAENLGWSYNIAAEEISSCVEAGRVVIDQSLSGKFYFVSFMEEDYALSLEALDEIRAQVEHKLKKEQRDISVSLQTQYAFENKDNLININDTFEFGVAQHMQSSELPTEPTSDFPLDELKGLQFV